ncbi:hypothetical protein GTW69_10955, partial [Streptomyces sp. SID7760]|nr:hypothetical protein [Streptomyces sp. SID7760]
GPVRTAALAAAATDRAVWRGITRIGASLATPREVFADPGFLARVRAAAPDAPAPAGPRPPSYTALRRAIAAHAPDRKEG